MKLKRGQKLCKNCNTINGVRSYNCKQCNHAFTMNKTPKSIKKVRLVINHKDLQRGDAIKVIGHSGPYYIDDSGAKTYITNKGKYKVSEVHENGILVFNEYGANEFLYMGPEQPSPQIPNLIRSPHKIVITKSREAENA